MIKKIAPLIGKQKIVSNKIIAKIFIKDKIFIYYNDQKRPVNVKGIRISINNPRNLLSLKIALIGLKNASKIAGIGIVLGKTSKGILCGLDIDNCVDENGVISEEAQKIINYLDSYTELSPSGRGVHILFFAKKKGHRCKIYCSWCKCLEMYDNNRYFTLTGNTINSKNIEYRQEQCDFIYDEYFKQDTNITKTSLKPNEVSLETALKKDSVLNMYWNGYRSNKSESDDDFAFMGKLLYWLRDVELAIKFFLESPYAQNKDDYHTAKMCREDYLRRTALNVIQRNDWKFLYE